MLSHIGIGVHISCMYCANPAESTANAAAASYKCQGAVWDHAKTSSLRT